jgi:hypothetical protein
LKTGHSISSLNSGDQTEVDDVDMSQEGIGSRANTPIPSITFPTWPAEINLVIAAGMKRLKLSLQGILVKAVFYNAFENIRYSLVFVYGFPVADKIPALARKSLMAAAESLTTRGGHYNASAAAIHQRLFSDDDYLENMICLVSVLHHVTTGVTPNFF